MITEFKDSKLKSKCRIKVKSVDPIDNIKSGIQRKNITKYNTGQRNSEKE